MSSKIIVLGATGYIGSATVKTLVSQKADVTAGVRDPAKAKDLLTAGAKIVKADMSQSQSELASILSNYNVLFIVTPGSIDRSNLAINAIKAAKEANIKYTLVLSLPSADNLSILFGRQFNAIEKELKSSGINYGLIRLPIFTDNIWGNAEPLKSHNTFYGPIDGNHKFTTVAVQDAALAASVILRNPASHIGKTYTITSDYKSSDEQAQSYSLSLGRQIKYVNGTYEGTKKALLAFMPEWQVDGVLELYLLMEKKDVSQTTVSNDFKKLTGSEPTTHVNWMWQNAKAF